MESMFLGSPTTDIQTCTEMQEYELMVWAEAERHKRDATEIHREENNAKEVHQTENTNGDGSQRRHVKKNSTKANIS